MKSYLVPAYSESNVVYLFRCDGVQTTEIKIDIVNVDEGRCRYKTRLKLTEEEIELLNNRFNLVPRDYEPE